MAGSTFGEQVIVALLVVAGLSVATAVVSARQDCGSCTPPGDNYVSSVSGAYTICIEKTKTLNGQGQSWSAEQVAGLSEGIEEYFGDYFESRNIPISFSFTEATEGQCPSHDIKIFMASESEMVNTGAWAEAQQTPDMRGAYIRVDAQYNGTYTAKDYWKNLGAHEMSHLLGLTGPNLPESCRPYTITAPTDGQWRTPPLCGDLARLAVKYPEDPTGGTEEEEPAPSGEGEECWDRYFVTYHYVWTGSSWYLYDVTYQYLGTYCYPLEDG